MSKLLMNPKFCHLLVDVAKNGNRIGVCLFRRTLTEKRKLVQKCDIVGDGYDVPMELIRNFSIIAHVDHGKSTLADRLLELTGAIEPNSGASQVLDKLPVERERGITVKAQTASLKYTFCGKQYLLNLIDTPGHVDFSNEVSRSLAACQGVVLLVDANQGVQAQTVANFYLAFSKEMVIIPVLNKIDLKTAEPERVMQQLNVLFGIEELDVLKVSAKNGTGVEDVLKAVVERLPPPPGNRSAAFRSLIIDSWYDRYKGAIALQYVLDGSVKIGEEICSFHSNKCYQVKTLGLLTPKEQPVQKLYAGQVGYLTCDMRSVKEAHIGDTLFHKGQTVMRLHEFKPVKPMVFAGIYPMDQSQNRALRSAIERLALNDPAVTVAVDSSPALGQGWRLGFLGLLHMEVFNQRLEQEYGTQAVITAPSVMYKATIFGEKNLKLYGGSEITISNPAHFPNPSIVKEFYEPWIIGTIITPDEYLGPIMSLCIDHRGKQLSSTNIDNQRVMLKFEFPLNEIVVDFHDYLKSVSSGYASFDYEEMDHLPSKLVKLEILLNGLLVDELSTIVHVSRASIVGRKICLKLKEIIPRQLIQDKRDFDVHEDTLNVVAVTNITGLALAVPRLGYDSNHLCGQGYYGASYMSSSFKGVQTELKKVYPQAAYVHCNLALSKLYTIAIQAKVGGNVLARETIKAYRKDVAAKLYGGDVTRRMKLLKRQAEGKKRMKMIANIELPRETFIDVLKR